MSWEQFIDKVVTWAADTGVKIIVSILILFISFRIITVLTRKLEKRLVAGRRQIDKTLTKTLIYLLRIGLKVLVALCLVGYLGIDTSGFAALIASLGVGIGLAVNGALSNLAGGVLLLLTRPFKIDDFIEAQGHSGTVEDIHIVSTRIRTPDNKVVYIPNGILSSNTIVNYSEKELRRVDNIFSISYSEDFERVKSAILDVVRANERIIMTPEPLVKAASHEKSHINVVVRVWTRNEDYWDVKFDIIEGVKKEFDRLGIVIPFEQIDVHLKDEYGK